MNQKCAGGRKWPKKEGGGGGAEKKRKRYEEDEEEMRLWRIKRKEDDKYGN